MAQVLLSTDTKHLLGDLMKNKVVHCSCNCLLKMDFIGMVVDYDVENGTETILHIKIPGKEKLLKIGAFHPGMKIEILSGFPV